MAVGIAQPAFGARTEIHIKVHNNTERWLIAKNARVLSLRQFGTQGSYAPDHRLIGLKPHETRTIVVTGEGHGLYSEFTYEDQALSNQPKRTGNVAIRAAVNWDSGYVSQYQFRLWLLGIARGAFPNAVWVADDSTPNNELQAEVVELPATKTFSDEQANQKPGRTQAPSAKVFGTIIISEKPVQTLKPQPAGGAPSPVAQQIDKSPAQRTFLVTVRNATRRNLSFVNGQAGGLGRGVAKIEGPTKTKGAAKTEGYTLTPRAAICFNGITLASASYYTGMFRADDEGSDYVRFQATLGWNAEAAAEADFNVFTLAPRAGQPDGIARYRSGRLCSKVVIENKTPTLIEGRVTILDCK